jgi:hypothetical protein
VAKPGPSQAGKNANQDDEQQNPED